MTSRWLGLITPSASCVSIPNVVLKLAFKLGEGNVLNLCHVNAGSIPSKIDQFRRVFEDTAAHVIIATETWFKSYRSDASVGLDGYHVLRNDRVGQRSELLM